MIKPNEILIVLILSVVFFLLAFGTSSTTVSEYNKNCDKWRFVRVKCIAFICSTNITKKENIEDCSEDSWEGKHSNKKSLLDNHR